MNDAVIFKTITNSILDNFKTMYVLLLIYACVTYLIIVIVNIVKLDPPNFLMVSKPLCVAYIET